MKMVRAQPQTRSIVDRRFGAEYQPTSIGSAIFLTLTSFSAAQVEKEDDDKA